MYSEFRDCFFPHIDVSWGWEQSDFHGLSEGVAIMGNETSPQSGAWLGVCPAATNFACEKRCAAT